uniref:Uncharacterized protein n=1 Tax=Arundo donax TaxID=35708 RepID=A0A0A8YQ35_ARUDO
MTLSLASLSRSSSVSRTSLSSISLKF